ncbi:MAG: SRPBCC family protein [Ignavibacteria bacterium]
MKIIKWILIIIVILVAIPLITAVFVKKDYSIEREVVINKPKQEVFEYVKFLKNQNNFSKWAQMDIHMRKTFTGTDGTPGFVSAWDSDSSDVGSGEQEIKAIKEGEKIDYEIRFKKPFESTSSAYMTTETVNGNQTKVKWSFFGHMSYPMNLMQVVMDMDKAVGSDLQTGLNNLKGIMEKQ